MLFFFRGAHHCSRIHPYKLCADPKQKTIDELYFRIEGIRLGSHLNGPLDAKKTELFSSLLTDFYDFYIIIMSVSFLVTKTSF